ncbi:MAG: efflux RND transporter periplasmic adaptor subunit [Clostridia bacterium]
MIKKNNGIILCFTVLLLITFLSGCSGKEVVAAIPESEEITVNIASVGETDIDSMITLNGKIKAKQEINIVPKVPGKVSSINFEVGQSVNEGDVLFTLDNTDATLQVAQAEASLSSAKVSLQKTKGGAVEQQVSQLRAALANSEMQYNDAKANYERIKELYEAGGMSQQAFEQAQTSYKVAMEQYNSAKTSLDLTVSKINPDNVMAAEAGVKQAQAAYEMAKVQLDNTVVKSPIAGIISFKNIEIGEQVSSAGAAMTVVDLSTVFVETSVPENLINKIRLDDKVQVDVDSAGIAAVEGRVSSVSPAADAKTQSYPIKVIIENDKQLLKSGMFAEVEFAVDRIENILAVPVAAIIDEQGMKYVYVVNEGKAQKREVKIGMSNGELIEVADGIEENQQVIIKGQNLLQDGSKIIVTK